MSCALSRSRSGCSPTSASSSPTTDPWRPAARSGSTRSSRHAEAKLLEPRDLGLGKALIAKLRERRTSPQREGGSVLTRGDQPLEALQVELVAFDPKHVAGRFGLQAIRTERLAELGNVDLERLLSRLGCLLVPKRVDQALRGDDLVRVHEQHREQGALLRASELELTPVVEYFERAKDLEVHVWSSSIGRSFSTLSPPSTPDQSGSGAGSARDASRGLPRP
jgi:hypothetical protein